MTIPAELAQAYAHYGPILEALRTKCAPIVNGIARSVNGHSFDRIKPIESILSKIEKECPTKPFEEIDNLYASTIIVPNEIHITSVEEQITSQFKVEEKRSTKTRKPEEFIFDVPQFILRLKEEPGRDEILELAPIKFEVQIKTEMQDAASRVSRGLSYKTKDLSWTRHRMSSRIWAMVEMIDELLHKLEQANEGNEDAKQEEFILYLKRNRIIKALEETLTPLQLPEDKRRLAITVEKYLETAKLDLSNTEDVDKMNHPAAREPVGEGTPNRLGRKCTENSGGIGDQNGAGARWPGDDGSFQLLRTKR